MCSSKNSEVNGFTLAETMISMAVLTFAFTVITPFILFTYKASIINENKNTLIAKVRYSYELMKQDAAKAQFVYGIKSSGAIDLDNWSKRLDAGGDSDVFVFVSTATSFDRGVASSLKQPVDLKDEIYRIVIYSLKPIQGPGEFYQLYRYEREISPSNFQSGSSGLPTSYNLSSVHNDNNLVLDKVSKVYTGSDSGAFFSLVPGKALGVSYITHSSIYDSQPNSSNQDPLMESNLPLQAVLSPLL